MRHNTGHWATDGPFIIAIIVVLAASTLYGLGLVVNSTGPEPVEPQSVFTLFGAVLGYAFGSRNRKEDIEVSKEERKEDGSSRSSQANL